MRTSRLPARAALAILLVGFSAVSLSGCMKGNKPRLDVPPPPLTEPQGEFREMLLEPVLISAEADPAPQTELRLLSGDSSLGDNLYTKAEPVLRRRTVQLLAQAQDLAASRGYIVVVLDAARTPDAHKALIAMADNEELIPAYDPEVRCPDVCGAAVDVTLLDARNEYIELAMGTRYMEMTDASNRRNMELERDHLGNRGQLARLMTDAGFEEGAAWWDFHDPAWEDYPELTEEDFPCELSQAALDALATADEAPEPEEDESAEAPESTEASAGP